MKKECSIFLFRHGTTPDNANGIFSGWRDVPLNEKGIRDAKIVALRLKNKKIDLAYQSNLLRSKQTLKEVLKPQDFSNLDGAQEPSARRSRKFLTFHKNVPIITDKRIAERCYGSLQGRTHLEIIQKYGFKQYDLWHRGYTNKPPRGESLKDVESRVLPFIRDLLRTIKARKINVAVSAHGNSMRALRRYFEKLSIKQMCTLYNDYETVYEYKIKV